MKLQGQRIEAFLKRPEPVVRAVLLYGPDHGLVMTRAAALGHTVVADLNDPFQVSTLTGSGLSADHAALYDEMAAMSLMGGRRLVRVQDVADSAAEIFSALLADPPGGDTLAVVEAGDLDSRSKLRKLFEAAANAAAIPCYVESDRDLSRVVAELLTTENLTAEPDALSLLAQNLVGDRMLVRGEIEKLALYMGAGNSRRVSLGDVAAVIADSAILDLDDPAWDAADGDHAALERSLARLTGEGMAPVAMLRAAQRHFQRLHLANAHLAKTGSTESALAAIRPPLFFKVTARFTAQLRRWSPARLRRALDLLTSAELACKTTGAADDTLCARTFHDIALLAGTGNKRAA